MSALTDIQDNIEKLRSLQESLHDLCTFISTLDLTSGAKEDTLIHGITELKEAFANIDLSSLETTLVSGLNEVKDAVSNIDFTDLENSIGEVKDAVANIDFSALAQETTLTQGIQDLKDVTAKETTLNSAKEEILTAVEKGAQESTLLAESEAIKQAIAAGSGSGITLATEEEYSSFKDEMQTKINDILSKGL